MRALKPGPAEGAQPLLCRPLVGLSELGTTSDGPTLPATESTLQHDCRPSPEFAHELDRILQERLGLPAFARSLSEWRARFLRDCQRPDLRFIIWMATRRCNLRCRYCVLPYEERGCSDLSTAEVDRIFSQIAEDFDASRIVVGITGGEATLRPDLVPIVARLVKLGYRAVAVDSNGVRYGQKPELLDRLVEAGMRCPTISVDGVGTGQLYLRRDRSVGALTWKALEYIQRRYPELGTTTICAASPGNLAEVVEVFRRFEQLGIGFARLSGLFPIGRARVQARDWLSPAQLFEVLGWVAEQRRAFVSGRRNLEIEFVDDGWCGLAWEGGLVRANYLYCRAGVSVLGLEHDGRLVGCPVIPAAFNLQGNARTERVSEVWRNRFRPFRDRSWLRQGQCASCPEWNACLGASLHNRDDQGRLLRCTAWTLERARRAASSGAPARAHRMA